ncbi:MAG: flagellar filament outer layer protein [Treponematales bacterium]
MKRFFFLLAIVLVSVGVVFAEQGTLIDFGKLAADDPETGVNNHTVQDFGETLAISGGSFTDEQKAAMKTSLAIGEWEVSLTSSSARQTNLAKSFTKEADSKKYEGKVLGVRVHFPVESWNGSATIRPPFEIPAYSAPLNDDGTPQENFNPSSDKSQFEDGYGVLKNVGTIKSVAVNAYGLNFPHGLWIYLLDNDGNEKEVFMGYLNFDGWAELIWNNPAYVDNVRNRDLRLYPIYPANTPFVKFNGFRIERNGNSTGGDFVGYVKDVQVIYDKATESTERDIDDEGTWKIIQQREDDKKKNELKNFGSKQLLRYLDKQKQATEPSFTRSSAAADGATQ